MKPVFVERSRRAGKTLAASMSRAEVETFMAADLPQIVPAVLRQHTDISIAHASAHQAAIELSTLKFAGATVNGQLETWARIREHLRAALDIADTEFARVSASEAIRVPRSA